MMVVRRMRLIFDVNAIFCFCYTFQHIHATDTFNGWLVSLCVHTGLREVYHTRTDERGTAPDHDVLTWSIEYGGQNLVGHGGGGTQGGVSQCCCKSDDARRRSRARVAQG